jgi:NAD(P)H dehydrogenase (quinone)
MSDRLQPRLLVTGASGHLGRRIVEILLHAGNRNLVAGSRNPSKLLQLAAMGAEPRRVDFDEPATLDDAFAGVERLLIISTDAIFIPGRRRAQHRAAVHAAVKAGVKHILYTSMPNPEPPSVMPIAPDHYATEQAIAKSGLRFTILRNSWYSENLIRSLPSVMQSGKWFTSAGEGRIPYVSRDDVARAAAAALSTGASESRRYDITGLEALMTVQIATVASEAFGKPIEVVQLSDEQLASKLTAMGVPEAWVPRRVATDANTRAGKFDIVSDAVKRLTGKEPQSLRDFLLCQQGAFAVSG